MFENRWIETNFTNTEQGQIHLPSSSLLKSSLPAIAVLATEFLLPQADSDRCWPEPFSTYSVWATSIKTRSLWAMSIGFSFVVAIGFLFAWAWIPDVQHPGLRRGRRVLVSMKLEELARGKRRAEEDGQIIEFRGKFSGLLRHRRGR